MVEILCPPKRANRENRFYSSIIIVLKNLQFQYYIVDLSEALI